MADSTKTLLKDLADVAISLEPARRPDGDRAGLQLHCGNTREIAPRARPSALFTSRSQPRATCTALISLSVPADAFLFRAVR